MRHLGPVTIALLGGGAVVAIVGGLVDGAPGVQPGAIVFGAGLLILALGVFRKSPELTDYLDDVPSDGEQPSIDVPTAESELRRKDRGAIKGQK